MSYASALSSLDSLIKELHASPGTPRRKFHLEEMQILAYALGNPERRFQSILVAGTNGKGSTSATLASILTTAGFRTGLYTSPHLSRVNERIRVGNQEISDDDFAATYFRVDDIAQAAVLDGRLPAMPSYFEAVTATAFDYFAQQQVEIAILEVGMGGRLDATNIVEPALSIITDISLDHTEWLGNTIAEIAREKAGILRHNGILVTLPQHPEANQAIGEHAVELEVTGINAVEFMPPLGTATDAPYTVLFRGEPILIDSPLKGAHQHRNLALALAALSEICNKNSYNIISDQIERGIRNTRWPGRLEEFHVSTQHNSVPVLFDVAHNPGGAWALRAALSNRPERPRTLIFGCLHDKAITEMSQILFPLFDRILLTPVRNPRSCTPEELGTLGSEATVCEDPAEAFALARHAISPDGEIVVCGSVFLVGELRTLLLQEAGTQA